METADTIAPDEIQVQPLDLSKPQGREPGLARDEQIIQQPDPGTGMNSMREKLEKLMAETKEPPKADEKKPEPKKEEAKKEEPKTDAKPDEKKEPEPETFTSAKAADWKKLKDARAAAEKERDEFKTKLLTKENEFLQLQTKLKAEDKTPEFTKELETIKADRDKLLEKLEAIDLERSPRFSERFDKAFASAAERAKNAVGEQLAERVEQLMHLPQSKWRKERLNEIREELTGIDQGQFDIAIAEWDRARQDKDTALADSKNNFTKLKQLQAEEQNRARELQKAQLDNTITKALEIARGYKAFQPVDGDEEHNATVKSNEAKIGKFFRMELPVEELATIPMVAAEGKRLAEKVIPAMEKEIAELKAALAATKGASPRIEGGKQHPSVGGAGGAKKGFVETFTENWPGNG